MTSGSDVEEQINNQISKLQGQESKLNSTLHSYENKIDSLTAEREESYVSLAETYLPELDAQAIKNTLKEVQGDVQEIFRKKQLRRKELENLMQASTEKKGTLEEKLGKVTSELNQKASERDSIVKDIKAELSQHPKYPTLAKEAKTDKDNLEKNEERAKEVKADAQKKLPSYENNKIFMYLVNKSFGTEEYDSKGIIRKLDQCIAEKVDYKNSKKSYDYLRAIPELVDLEVSKRKEKLEEKISKIKAIEKEVADNHGLTAVLEEGKKLGMTREEMLKAVSKLNSEYESYASERKESDGTKDSYHKEAIQKLKGYLKGDNIAELKKLARNTPDTKDDKLVDRIEEIDYSVRELKDKAKETRDEREKLTDKLKGLKKVMDKFRSNDFESYRSYFDSDFDINTLILAYMAGKMSENSLWSKIDDNHHFRVEHHDSYSSSSSHDDYSSSSSSFGGGGFSGGGGFGGGGFSSGSGF